MKQPSQVTGKARLAGYCVNALIAAPAVADRPKYKLTNPARALGAAFVLAIVSLIATSAAHAEPFAYVTNLFDNVSVIDTASNTVTATVAVGSGPEGVAITPDGAFAYVTNGNSGTVSVIDTASNAVTATVTVVPVPLGVAITPDGAFAYVTNINSNIVWVIDTASNAVTTTVTVGRVPFGVAITPDGAFAYVTNFASNNVSVIDTASNAVIATVAVGGGPIDVAITPDGAFAYVVKSAFFGTVSVIDTASNAVTATVAVGSHPEGVAITPDGAFAYVTNRFSNNVSVIDTASNTVIATVAVGQSPHDVAITPDGAFAYVTNFHSNNVSVIDTASNAVTATVTVGNGPRDVAITPEPLAIEVRIDIKPGSNKNNINLRSKGNIAVAILSTGKFDATQVNWETVTFGPKEATEIHQRSHLKDVDKDGDLDFLLHFKIRETGIECGDKTATLTGETFNGEAFTGSDKITVKCH